jgi:carbohydrate kinase (thermoresistant glucokinase family)
MPESVNTHPPVLVIMGVSGSGKTTIGTALAERLDWNYQEGDAFHPATNVAKLQAGQPLRDEDRKPWLAAIAQWIDARRAAHMPGIVGCSALKRSYRYFLRAGRPQVWFVYLRVARAELQRRVETRHHEYMPASLLESQLRTLQEPAADEPRTLTIDVAGTIGDTADAILQRLRNAGILQADTVAKWGCSGMNSGSCG